MHLIVYAHPWAESFNHAVLQQVVDQLRQNQQTYHVIDLYQDGFNPVMDVVDLRLFAQGETTDDQVRQYQQLLATCDELVLIYPIWWSGMPAILKGFLDKVWLPGFAYEKTAKGIRGLLHQLKRVTVLTTAESSHGVMRVLGHGMVLKYGLVRGISQAQFVWRHCSFRSHHSLEKRQQYLNTVAATVANKTKR